MIILFQSTNNQQIPRALFNQRYLPLQPFRKSESITDMSRRDADCEWSTKCTWDDDDKQDNDGEGKCHWDREEVGAWDAPPVGVYYHGQEMN